jgi:hypothetical protein
MKKALLRTILVAMSVAVLVLSLGVSASAAVRGAGTGSPGPQQGSSLDEAETEWLIYMREEEKLARDVYLAFYREWGMPIFSNIAESEQNHMDAILKMLNRYGIADPAAGKDEGVFTNGSLQNLYDGYNDDVLALSGFPNLMDWGLDSVVAAYHVGVFIEETDIDDLDKAIVATENSDIVKVYENLLAGSYRHLDAFETHVR